MAEELENSVNYKGNPEEDRRECIVPEALAGQRLDQALSELYPEFSRSRLQAWIKSGKAQLNGDLKDPSDKVWGGETIVLWPEPEPGATPDQPEAIPLKVVFEDAALLVIDKPAGMVVHPGNGNPRGTLLNALLHHCPQVSDLPRAGIVHRLDKETSGLLVVAKTLKAHTDLVRQLACTDRETRIFRPGRRAKSTRRARWICRWRVIPSTGLGARFTPWASLP